ncbi:1233_t:CDS:2, partial [Acaulospora colombiana]
MVCQNPNCMYLHEPGEEADSFTKEDLASVKYHLKEHASTTEPHKLHQLGRPPSSGPPNSVFPPHANPPSHPTTSHPTTSHTVPPSHPTTSHTVTSNSKKNADAPPSHRTHGSETDKGSNDEREEASALPPTASWANKPPSTETTPILHNQQLSLSQSSFSQITQSSQNTTLSNSHSQQSSPPPLQPSVIQEQKSKRLVSTDAQPLGTKAIKKTDLSPMPASIPNSNDIEQNAEREQPQQLTVESNKEKSADKKGLPEPHSQQLNDKSSPHSIKQSDITADFDQTLSALSDGSFSFSFNAPLLNNSVLPEEKHKKISVVPDNGIVGASRVVSPPPGVGFPMSDISKSASEFVQQPISYTGPFNPFASDDDKFDPFTTENQHLSVLGVPSLGNSSIPEIYSNESGINSQAISNSVKSRNSSRFGFAQEDGNFSPLRLSDPLATKDLQEGFRALFPNVNISFGPSDVHQEAMWNTSNDSSTFAPLRRTLPPGVPISGINQAQSLLNANSSTGLDHNYHQNILMQHQQLNGNNVTTSIKSPPPGIYTQTPRVDYGITGWNPQNAPWDIDEEYVSRQPTHPPSHQSQPFIPGITRQSRDDAQDFFGAFLKAASVNSNAHEDLPNEDPAIMSVRISQADNAYRAPGAPVMPQQQFQPMQNVGSHRLSVFERVARTGDEQISSGFGVGIGLGSVDAGINEEPKEIQTSALSERINEIGKETDQTVSVVVAPDKDAVCKRKNEEIGDSSNTNHALMLAPAKDINIKSNSRDNSQKIKSVNIPSRQPLNRNIAKKSVPMGPDSMPSITPRPKCKRRQSKKQANSNGKHPFTNNTKYKDVQKNDDNVSLISRLRKDSIKTSNGASQRTVGDITNAEECLNELGSEKEDLSTNETESLSTDKKAGIPSDFNDEDPNDYSTFSPATGTSSDLQTPTSEFLFADLLSKDFNFSTSPIFNLSTSLSSSLFSFSNNNSSDFLNLNGVTNFWNNSFNTNNFSNTENGSNDVRIKDLERQLANAKREEKILEHRLRDMVKKNTSLLRDMW